MKKKTKRGSRTSSGLNESLAGGSGGETRDELAEMARPTPSATFTIQPPEPFDFTKPQEWERWIRRFDRFRLASNLNATPEENQVNTLVYCMGDEAEDVLKGLTLTADARKKYSDVKAGFDAFFVPKKNVIYERAKFNQRVQLPGETVDSFITALYSLAEHCNYGQLHEELIRDRLVVGLRNVSLSEKLQLDKDLTLQTAIEKTRLSEEIRRQQSDLRGENSECNNVDAVHATASYRKPKFPAQLAQAPGRYKPARSQQSAKACYRCGKTPVHGKAGCPATDAVCHSCGKKGHYSKVCRNSATSLNAVTVEEEDSFFLGAVDAGKDPWTVQLQVRDKKVCFKIDTGADVTALPAEVYGDIAGGLDVTRLGASTRPLFGPGGNVLNVLGVARETLRRGEKMAEEDIYVVKDLHTALLGRPAIQQLQLVSRADSITMDTVKQQYPKLCSGLGLVRRPYALKLKPGAVPFSLSTPRRVPLPLMGKVREEIGRMEKMGVITKIEEPTEWCAGMVVVQKKEGTVRICVDYTKMNESVCREKFILPSVEHTLGMLAGATVFSKLDANMGFWQVPLTKESAKYTTFITPFGRYYFNRLPFGIASAPEHFQRMMMTEVTTGLDGVLCHMDDVLVWGRTQDEHDMRLHAVLQKAQETGITLNMDKCELTRHTVKFLGHVLSADGVKPDPEKTSAVQEMDPPKNVSELRSFLGMVNQLGRFIPHLAEKHKVLRDLLSKKNHWYWGEEQQAAFDQLKAELSSTPVLTLYNPNSALKISADASSFGLGAVLLQQNKDGWSPVAYASRSMTPTEQRYAQVEKEALAATWACERFSSFILGRQFELETDHKPLVSLLGGKALDDLPPRIQRFRMRLLRYDYIVKHVPGKSLWTADTLSRAPLRSKQTHTDTNLLENTNIYVDSVISNLPVSGDYLASLREHLKADSTCSTLMKYCTDGWPDKSQLQGELKRYWEDMAVLTVHDGLLLRGTRLVIPSALQGDVLHRLHEGHLGVTKCRGRAKDTVWWPGLSSQLNNMVLKCKICIKERQNVKEPLMPTDMPDRPWQTVGADLFTLRGKTYLLVVDYFSRYVEIALLSPTKSTDVVLHLKSMFARHGICEFFKSDNGPQFSGSYFKDFAAKYGFVHTTSSPKFPQSNGEAERAVQTVKNLLTKASDPYLALLAYRATPLQNGYSPAELLMGRRLRTTVPTLPTQLNPALPDYDEVGAKEKEKRKNDARYFDKRHRARTLRPLVPGEDVWVTDARVEGTVISQHNTPRSYIVQGPQGTLRRNRHHLVPLQTNNGVIDAEPQVEEEPPTPEAPPVTSSTTTETVQTRAGREVRPPQRLVTQ